MSDGFTPSDVGIAEESMQNRPSLPNTSLRWSTTPRSFESAMRQPPSGCDADAPRKVSFMNLPSPLRSTTLRIAASAASRTRTDCSDSS